MPRLSKRDQAAKVSATEANRRRLVALAELRELQLREKRGALVDAKETLAAVAERFKADADALLNWPARVAAEIAASLGVEERLVHQTLDRYVRAFMRERSMVAPEAQKGGKRATPKQTRQGRKG